MSQTTTIKVGESAKTITLPEGKSLVITGSAGAVGVAYLLDPALGGTNSLQSWTVGVGSMAPIGPYENTQKIHLTCSAGSIAAVTKEAVLTISASPAPTAPGQPAKPVLTALAGAVSLAWTPGAVGSTPTTGNVWTDINGNTTALTTNPQVITAPAGTPYTGTVKTQNAQGFGPASVQADEVTPTAVIQTYAYKALPNATTTPANTRAIISDWPGAANRNVINNGLNWEPYPVAQVRQHINSRDGCGLNNTVTPTTGGLDSFNEASGIKVAGAASAIKVFFSNNARQGGSEAGPTGYVPTIESSFGVSLTGTKYSNTWDAGGGRSKTLASGDTAWATADPALTLTDGQVLSFNQHTLFAASPTYFPCQANNGLMSNSNSYQTFDQLARGVGLTDSTMGAMNIGRQLIGPVIMAPGAITGLTNWRPVIGLIGDSNRAWARQGLQASGLRWADLGNDSMLMSSLAATSVSTQIRYDILVAMGATHAFITLGGGDITGLRTAAQIKTDKATIQARMEALGIIVIWATTPPKTTADETAVVGAAQWQHIQDHNADTRANSKYGFVELFDAVGDRTTGLWLPPSPGTPATGGDGIHMVQARHDIAQAYTQPQFASMFKQG